ncbi:MAG TPA: TetR/AcrR family transcriptional regulator [bacterium]|nr:TetR/AcrR family transcriptional regulator [bacterium]
MKTESTKQKILQAAQKVFVEEGLKGARMQKIADIAGVNKAMLHYYFKNKDNLFRKVFESIAPIMFTRILNVLNEDIDLFEKITKLVDNYLTLLNQNKNIPILIITEINRQPDKFSEIFINSIQSIGVNPVEILQNDINGEVKKGRIRDIPAQELIVNTISLCVFPIAGRKIFKKFTFENDDKKLNEFLKNRKKTVSEFIINSIKI